MRRRTAGRSAQSRGSPAGTVHLSAIRLMVALRRSGASASVSNGSKSNASPVGACRENTGGGSRSEEHTSELQSLMRISYAVFCLKKKHHKINSIMENIDIKTDYT